MKKVLGLSSLLVVALTAMAFGKPVDKVTSYRAEMPDLGLQQNQLSGVVALQAAHGFIDTVEYGGTYWAADSARWEAVRDSVWTFKTGIGSSINTGSNPNKPVGYHQNYEGWHGYDQTLNPLPYFRRSTTCALNGSFSFWAGVTLSEANDLCFAAGQGYGSNWNLTITKSFSYPGSGAVTLAYNYAVDAEPGFDYAYAVVDTANDNDATNDIQLASYTGAVSGAESITLTQGGGQLPAAAKTIKIKFLVHSDGSYNDQDGNYPTVCGHTAVDNVTLSGAITDVSTFEAGSDGWALEIPTTGTGDFSNIVSLSDLPPPAVFCPCGFKDSVLVFYDLLGLHPLDQDNVAVSPWINLRRAGNTGDLGRPGRLMIYDVYAEMPLANYIFVQLRARYYPSICGATGLVVRTAWKDQNTVFYFGETPFCNPINAPRTRDYSGVVEAGAEQIQVSFGMLSLCRTAPFGPPCTGVSNTTPWMDNVALGIFGVSSAPSVSLTTFDLVQDNFAQDGTLRPTSTGRLDVNRLKNGSTPGPGTILGDTLVAQGDGGNTEVYMVFTLRPSPGTSAAAISSYFASKGTGVKTPAAYGFGAVNAKYAGVTWYAARMDTTEQGGTKTTGRWMSCFHESDSGFSGTDTTPDGADPGQNANEILPDHLLTPGSRVDYFLMSRYATTDARNPGTAAQWYILPDTTGGRYLEAEILPSSMAADSSWNCTLYNDHHGDRDGAERTLEMAGLTASLGAGGNTAEGTRWDRFDNQTPSSGQLSLGRPIQTNYGMSIIQVFAYKNIVHHSGTLPTLQNTDEDCNIIGPWLTLRAVGNNRWWGSGDGLAQSMFSSGEPVTVNFLSTILGATRTCDALRLANCPTGTAIDTTFCIATSAAASPAFPTSQPVRIRGNGCPTLRALDLLATNGSVPTAVGQLNYVKLGIDRNYASVTNVETIDTGKDYKTVLDGMPVGELRSNNGFIFFGCNTTTAAIDRTDNVLDWFASTVSGCKIPAGLLAVPGDGGTKPPQFRYALGNAYPNPMNPTTRIQFTNGVEGGRVRLQIFDVTGRLVKTLVDGNLAAGAHEVQWDGSTESGTTASNGMYFYKMSAGNFVSAKKLVMMK